jgi:predicted XRE-type DNA-binding protein
LLPEKIGAWYRHTKARHGLDPGTIESSKGTCRKEIEMNDLNDVEAGSGNVYADLGMPDADEMFVKAQLASRIGEIIKSHKWSQQQAADVLGLTQPKLSRMLRGQFRGISEAKMLDCLTRLGRDVQIVIGPARRTASSGRVAVVLAA